MLEGLDPDRKRILLQFLYEANLIIKVDKPIISLVGANLSGAGLRGADLSKAEELTREQIEVADGDEYTLLPDHLHRPAHWEKTTPEEGKE